MYITINNKMDDLTLFLHSFSVATACCLANIYCYCLLSKSTSGGNI